MNSDPAKILDNVLKEVIKIKKELRAVDVKIHQHQLILQDRYSSSLLQCYDLRKLINKKLKGAIAKYNELKKQPFRKLHSTNSRSDKTKVVLKDFYVKGQVVGIGKNHIQNRLTFKKFQKTPGFFFHVTSKGSLIYAREPSEGVFKLSIIFSSIHSSTGMWSGVVGYCPTKNVEMVDESQGKATFKFRTPSHDGISFQNLTLELTPVQPSQKSELVYDVHLVPYPKTKSFPSKVYWLVGLNVVSRGAELNELDAKILSSLKAYFPPYVRIMKILC